jgi:hypothetical protein
MSEIEKFRREHGKKSLFDLYVLSQATHPGSTERHVVLALIEQRKDRRNYWTLVAALVAAVTGFLGIVWQIFVAGQ